MERPPDHFPGQRGKTLTENRRPVRRQAVEKSAQGDSGGNPAHLGLDVHGLPGTPRGHRGTGDLPHDRGVVGDRRGPQVRMGQSPVVPVDGLVLREEPRPAEVPGLLEEFALSVVLAVLDQDAVDQGRVRDELRAGAVHRHRADRVAPQEMLQPH